MNWRTAAVLAMAAAQFINLFPTLLNFDRFAFGDCGWALTVDHLTVDDHQKPVTDFAYFYGLLTLLVDRGAFAIFGRTPLTVIGIYAVCSFAIAISTARIATALNLRICSSVFLIACMPMIVIPRGFPSPAHALEAALLMLALAEHAKGRLDRSLVLAVLAVLAKPSLGYFYGLLLVVSILTGWPGGASRWRRLCPAAAVAAGMLGLLTAIFGVEPLLKTLLPLDGMKVYSDEGVGFLFGAGKLFWLPAEPKLEYYFGIPGIWLASTAVLFLAALRLLPRIRETGANVAITCALLHGVFVFLLFGNQWSWIYYPHILFVGTAVALNGLSRRVGTVLAVPLTILAIVAQVNWLWVGDFEKWTETQRFEETSRLYAPAEEAAEWERARGLARNHPGRVLVLTKMGCPQFLAPELQGPQWWCLIETIMTPREEDRILELLRNADWIVSPNWHDNDLPTWKTLASERHHFEDDPATTHFKFLKLYRRKK